MCENSTSMKSWQEADAWEEAGIRQSSNNVQLFQHPYRVKCTTETFFHGMSSSKEEEDREQDMTNELHGDVISLFL